MNGINEKLQNTKFGDIIIWDKPNENFIIVKNYHKLTNLFKTNNFELCCMALGDGKFISVNIQHKAQWNPSHEYINYLNKMCSTPLIYYMPTLSQLSEFYNSIENFNRKIKVLQKLKIPSIQIERKYYWTSTELTYHIAFYFDFDFGIPYASIKEDTIYMRPFVKF